MAAPLEPDQLPLVPVVPDNYITVGAVINLLLLPALRADDTRTIIRSVDSDENNHYFTVHDTSTQLEYATLTVKYVAGFLRIFMRPAPSKWLRTVRDPANNAPANEYLVLGQHKVSTQRGLVYVLDAQKIVERIVARTLNNAAFSYVQNLVEQAIEQERYANTPYLALRSMFSLQKWDAEHDDHSRYTYQIAQTNCRVSVRITHGPQGAVPHEALRLSITVSDTCIPNVVTPLVTYSGSLSDYNALRPSEPVAWHLTGDLNVPVNHSLRSTTRTQAVLAVMLNTIDMIHQTLQEAYDALA